MSTSWDYQTGPDETGACNAKVNEAPTKLPCSLRPTLPPSTSATVSGTAPAAATTTSVQQGQTITTSTQASSAISSGEVPDTLPTVTSGHTSDPQATATIELSGLTVLPVNGTSNNTVIVPHSNAQKGLAGGAVAGVAIGMLLAGALIAGVLFFFLLRRQKRRQAMSAAAYSRQHPQYNNHNVGPEKGANVVPAGIRSIDELLPQPVEDDAITGDLSKIRDNIKNHVRTYYHSGPISATDLNDAGIRDIAALTGSSAAVIINALSNPSTRDNALRAIVGSVILTRCTGERSPSLLPSELAALSMSIPVNNSNNSQLVLFSKWKTITGVLLQQQFGKQSQDPGRTQSFQDAIASLDSILAPFIKDSVDGGQRRKNLDMILGRAANFAFLLFAQPGSFRFDFTSHQGGLTVFPALVQTVGDQGQPLSPIKLLAEKEVVAA